MKILQINASYKPAYIYGGPTMSVSKLCEALAKANGEVTVFTTTANGKSELPLHQHTPILVDNVPVYYFKRLTKDHSHFSPKLLWAVWKQVKQFDVVHIHAWWNLVSILSCLLALMRGVPAILSPRGTLSSYSFQHKNNSVKYLFHRLIGKKLLKKCVIHATSKLEANAVKELVNFRHIYQLPNFVNMPNHAIERPKDKLNILKLLFFSRIDPKKGLDILLKALPLIEQPWHLTIAGNGDETYIKQLKTISDANATSTHINWIGFQGKDKFEIMASHDMLILPSHNENFANVVIESLSVGTAVIVSKPVGLSNYVVENELGAVCDCDEFSLSSNINLLANHKKKLANIVQTAPGIIRRDFNEDNLVKQYINMYQQTISHG